MAYTGVPYLTQNTATRYRNCTEGYYNWTGTAFTVPLYDVFVDTRIPPQPSVSPPQPPVPPRPPAVSDNTTPSVPPQIYVPPLTPVFPTVLVGSWHWYTDSYCGYPIKIPGDFVNGPSTVPLGPNLVRGSDGNIYDANASVTTAQGPVITTVNTDISIIIPTGNTDPIIPPMSVTIDLAQPPPVEATIIIDTNVDTNVTNIDTNVSTDNNSFNINNSQQWYDNYNYDSYWW